MRRGKNISKRKAMYICIMMFILIGICGFILGKLEEGILSSIFMLLGVMTAMIGCLIGIFNNIE